MAVFIPKTRSRGNESENKGLEDEEISNGAILKSESYLLADRFYKLHAAACTASKIGKSCRLPISFALGIRV